MPATRIQQIMNTLLRPFIGSCEETQEQLSDHLDGSLPADRERRVSRHLRYCRRCRSVYQSLARTVERVRSLGRTADEPEPDVSAVDAVMDRIRRSDL